jgi:hypothetical protein
MATPPRSVEAARASLLDQIAAITTMQPGTLAEEWRGRSGTAGGGASRLGPYYKHQVWKDGRNVSRRVPAEEAALLREDIDNARRFEHLTGELARLNIEHTLALRAAQARDPDAGEGKKNSARKRSGRDTPRRKPSSPKRGRP